MAPARRSSPGGCEPYARSVLSPIAASVLNDRGGVGVNGQAVPARLKARVTPPLNRGRNDASAIGEQDDVSSSEQADRTHVGAIYIGRGSKWGNPFVIGKDGTRAEVIEKYGQWLADQHMLLRSLDELRDRDLLCFAHRWPATAICSRPSPAATGAIASSGGAG